MTIDILMITSSNFISQTRVTMYSVCMNKKPETEIIFTIFCDKELDEASRRRLITLEEIFHNIKVNFYEGGANEFKDAKSECSIPKLAYYRLIAPRVVKADKAIYLDSDLIVQLDITELYETDMEGYYIAGVRDLYPVLHPNLALEYAENYNLRDFSDYINSGVLLMNLELMRRDNIVEAFIREAAQKNKWVDQDVFNRVCSGRIRLIDWKFNYVVVWTKEDYEFNCGQNFKAIGNKGEKEILHFSGPYKPWETCNKRRANIWWDCAREALEKTEYESLYRVAFIGNDIARMTEIINKCLQAETVIIVGYSDHGVFVRNTLLKYGIAADVFFADNNPRKRKLMLANHTVYSLEEASRKYKNAIWINVVQKYREEIMEQLRGLKIADEQIVNYLYK